MIRFLRDMWHFMTMSAQEFHGYSMARRDWPTHDEAMNLFHGKAK